MLSVAYRRCLINGGAPGVDGQMFEDIENYGQKRWLDELAEELRTKTYSPQPVRRLGIPKPDGTQRPLGIPTIREFRSRSPGRRIGPLGGWNAPGADRTRRGAWTGMGFDLVEEGGEPFEGFRWRTDERLKINFFWLLHFVTENAARQNRAGVPNPVHRVWFDHIVLATEYVGPIQEQDGAARKDDR